MVFLRGKWLLLFLMLIAVLGAPRRSRAEDGEDDAAADAPPAASRAATKAPPASTATDDSDDDEPALRVRSRKERVLPVRSAAREPLLNVRSKVYSGYTFEDAMIGDGLEDRPSGAAPSELDARYAFGVSVSQNVSLNASNLGFGTDLGAGFRGFGGGVALEALTLNEETGAGYAANGENGADYGGDGGGAGFGGAGLGLLGGRGGFTGGEAGGATSTTFGVRAGYLLAKEAGIYFDGDYNLADNFINNGNSNGTSANPAAPNHVFLRAGIGALPLEPLRLDFSIIHRETVANTDITTDPATGLPADTGSQGSINTLFNLRGRYALSRPLSLFTNFSYSLEHGLLDPSLGVSTRFQLYSYKYQFLGVFFVFQATAPLSQLSQSLSKITALTAMAGPVYRYDDFTASLAGIYSYNIYNNQSSGAAAVPAATALERAASSDPTFGGLDGTAATSAGTITTARTLYFSSGNLNLAYRFSRHWRAGTGFAAAVVGRDDASIVYNSTYTVADIGYFSSGVAVSANFSLVSDPTQSQGPGFPNRPFVGVRLGYTFGNRMAFRGPQPHSDDK